VRVCAGCQAPLRLQGIAVQQSDDARSLSARVFSALDLELAAPDHMRPTGGRLTPGQGCFHGRCSYHICTGKCGAASAHWQAAMVSCQHEVAQGAAWLPGAG
jgi:hypothetical protein